MGGAEGEAGVIRAQEPSQEGRGFQQEESHSQGGCLSGGGEGEARGEGKEMLFFFARCCTFSCQNCLEVRGPGSWGVQLPEMRAEQGGVRKASQPAQHTLPCCSDMEKEADQSLTLLNENKPDTE